MREAAKLLSMDYNGLFEVKSNPHSMLLSANIVLLHSFSFLSSTNSAMRGLFVF